MSFKSSRWAALALTLAVIPAQAADLTVAVTGVKDDANTIRIALYSHADGFRHEDKAAQILSVPAKPGTVFGTFHDLAPGRYAVIAYHDENGNQRLDLVLGMFPAEGWGLSNDPDVIGPPSFADSAFDLGEEAATVTVPLHY